jgi:hypothetical protein
MYRGQIYSFPEEKYCVDIYQASQWLKISTNEKMKFGEAFAQDLAEARNVHS